ncbi:HD domain-containing protein [Oryzomonas japonica]|uniref:HD domain-containing protein n=1 Tax=Oryzomonas japonica TaxID=2603858 RepID=A0A7J4ZVQ6_9BACT|nr:HD domain-containing protein [Oryzomonas japonica]KAB0667632.1 HD domain-containing protein [Oryzomonas japonica]
MEQQQLAGISRWFDDYTRTFLDTDPEGLVNIQLKIEHTRKVCAVSDILATGERLSANEARIAGAIALLHDVGRFPQYRRWRTFRDSQSDNHARLSVEVLREHHLLDGLDPAERLLIEEAVRFHNLLELPQRVSSPTRLFMRLIRDADKLDIWRVFLELFTLPEERRASAATLDLPDLPGCTPACRDAFLAHQVVRLDLCRVLNDFKLLQISWALDLGFASSYRLLLERDYITRLAGTINGKLDIGAAIEYIGQEAARRVENFQTQ